MKKKLLIIVIFLFISQSILAEDFTIFTGTTSVNTEFFGLSFGGEVIDFLFINFDFFNYLKEDESLHSDIPAENRGKFLAGSINFELKLPLHLVPHLDKLDFIQPCIHFGLGYGMENLDREFTNVPDIDDKTGFFTKLRQFKSSGIGLVIMISPSIGIKIDYRTLKIAELERMGWPSRSFTRFYFGICLGKYKNKKN